MLLLGGMQYTVQYQIQALGKEGISKGDVILCNHPKAGGSHLPDLTVITPVACTLPLREINVLCV